MFKIVSAGYGAGSKWRDLTEKVTKEYQAGQREFFANNQSDGPDPFPLARKVLSIVVQIGNRYFTMSTNEHDPGGVIILPSGPKE